MLWHRLFGAVSENGRLRQGPEGHLGGDRACPRANVDYPLAEARTDVVAQLEQVVGFRR